MFSSLRRRLIFSHILPAVLIIPLMGVIMVYVLETRILLDLVYSELVKDAQLMAELTSGQPAFFQSSQVAQALVDGVGPYLSGRASLVTPDGLLLASSDWSEFPSGPYMVELPDLSGLSPGQVIHLQNGPVAEVYTPVFDSYGQPVGAVRMSTPVLSVSEQLYQLRYLLGAVLLLGVLGGIALGSYLAFTIDRPLQQVTDSIRTLAEGDRQVQVEVAGPDEVRTLAQSFNALVLRLGSLETARRQLLANLVHELGRPLGAIRSAIQALLKGAGDDPQLQADLLNGLDSETLRLQRLLDDLAGLYGQVLGALELNRLPLQLEDWLGEILPPWEAAARQKGLAWEVEIAPDLPSLALDADRLAQALGNLLSNAIKFTPAGGKVTTVVRVEGAELVIQVSDTGLGIPQSEQQAVFEPFFRGAHGRRIVQGMGLGLSIAREIVLAHGGTLELESAPGTGSTFTVRLPVNPKP